MKNKVLQNGVLFVLVLLVGLTASLWGETRTLNYQGFTEVSVASGMFVEITQSQTYSVRVTADPQDFAELRAEQRGNRLEFFMDSDRRQRRPGRVEIQITMPTLSALNLSGGSEGHLSMNVSEDFAADLSGGASLAGNLNCGDVRLGLSGGSKTTLAGRAENLNLNGSGGSRVLFRDFAVKDLDANLSGGSNAVVTLDGVINANMSGGSQVTFYGNPTLGETRASGGSRIKRGE
jgi:hypothetical protein